METNNRILRIGVALALVFSLAVFAKPAVAAHDFNLFELDGNAVQSGALDEWDALYTGGGNALIFTGVIADPGQDTIFVGGRKDIQDIPQWGWKNGGGFPDKDDITNAYAAAYLDNGDLIIHFGADRYANNGDAYLAFWFFQNQVGLNPDGTFSGHHEVGDLLVLVNYPQSVNESPEINVVEWNPAEADVAKNLKLLFAGVVCGSGDGDACAISNLTDETSPWPYTPKSGTSGTFPFESFFEGGINLTQILGSTPCFGSFMAETRSSKRFTATLKDFVLSDFPVCEISVEKTCDVVRLANENDATDKYFVVDFDATVTNTGAGAFPAGSLITVTDDAGTPSDTSDDVVLQEVLANPLGVDESVPFSGQFFSNVNPPYNTITASLAFESTVVDADPFSIDCNNLILNPSLSLSKLCWTELETVGPLLAVKANFSGEVCNTGDVPLTVTVVDDKAGTVLSSTLLDVGDCSTITGSYMPTQANGGVTDPSNAMFSDTFRAVGTSPVPGVSDQIEEITANCPLCL